jgi:hypothetical protein
MMAHSSDDLPVPAKQRSALPDRPDRRASLLQRPIDTGLRAMARVRLSRRMG